ncbi:MAG TPA: right-handed parallel beta-helix repeat-containing protein [Candidatus Acidoferrales bacterium]|jgi:hypothetical protein|nr:right-handed parallel beta-helix repeat-containing protein [Candidatus Acidoferrales bacterium]
MFHFKPFKMGFALVLISAQSLAAATYYVAPHGHDADPGTIDRPWATVSRATGGVAPGDVIILRDGVYGPEGSTDFPVSITRPGSPTSWIFLEAEHKWGAILDCQPDPNAQTACSGYINLRSAASYWVFQDLVLQHGTDFGMISNSTPAAHDILVRGCRFEYIGRRPNDSAIGEAGFYAGEGSRNFTFDGNVFHDIGRTSGLNPFHDHGLYLHASGTTIVNNIFYPPVSGWGIQTADGFSGLIAYNTFAFPMQNPGGHIVLWGSNSQVTIRNNIFFNPGGGVAIYYSTVNISSGGCSVDHNIITGAAPGFVPGCSFSSSIQADAGLVNAVTAPFDFHLRHGSPAIDAGAPGLSVITDFDGAVRPEGAAPDIGAYEFPGPASPRAPAKPVAQPATRPRIR